MDSVLFKIQESVIEYAQVISQIAHVDVEVMDMNFMRVAGTGIFTSRINENMENESFIYQQVMKSGETMIVTNPREDEICKNCPTKLTCVETFEISTPIIKNEEMIGVIGMVSNDFESKKVITNNLDDYLAFLDQIADFIAIKAFEYKENLRIKESLKTLQDVTEHIEEGVITIDENNKIININDSGKKQLNITGDVLNKFVKVTSTGDFIEDAYEYVLEIKDERYSIVGNIINIEESTYNKIKKIIIFSNFKNIKDQLLNNQSVVYPLAVENILGTSKSTRNLKDSILKVANSTSTVLITGESGTGKEMVATAIWKSSDRKDRNFVAVNCGAIPEPLLESELFGYVKGAFTGADNKGRVGKFELANDGIIFLDEIGDMPLYLQVKLLRVLQEKEIVRLGSNRKIPLNLRVIAATNKNLEEMVKNNEFREDLYYRLNVIPIHISPLRERIEDIEPIMEKLIKKYIKISGKFFDFMDKETKDILTLYDWPGNVRELENIIEYMINMMNEDGILNKYTLPENILYGKEEEKVSIIQTIDNLEKNEIKKSLEVYGETTESKKIIADKLGISLATLYRKLTKYNL